MYSNHDSNLQLALASIVRLIKTENIQKHMHLQFGAKTKICLGPSSFSTSLHFPKQSCEVLQHAKEKVDRYSREHQEITVSRARRQS